MEFTEDSIGDALATRALLDMLRQAGRLWWWSCSVRRGRSIAILVKAGRTRPRSPPRPEEVKGLLELAGDQVRTKERSGRRPTLVDGYRTVCKLTPRRIS